MFQAMLANAVQLCDAKFGTLYHYDGKAYRAAALPQCPAHVRHIRKARTGNPS